MAVRDKSRALAKLYDEYLMCRDRGLGHLWINENQSHRYTVDGSEVVGRKTWLLLSRTCICSRCGAKKVTHYRVCGQEFLVMGSTYTYPDGYLIEGGVPAAAVRLEQLARAR